MNALHVSFHSTNRPLKVVDFDPQLGVTFDRHADASPLNLAIGLQPLLPGLLDSVRQRHDWRNREFFLDVQTDNGGLRISGFDGDPTGLPAGVYDINLEFESYQFSDAQPRVIVHNAQTTEVMLHEIPDPRRVQVRNPIDALTSAVIHAPASEVDGLQLAQWLISPDPRPPRQACLLNILAKLRVPPDPTRGFAESFTSSVDSIFFADVDRIYAAVRPGLRALLDRLVQSKLWVFEGKPAAAIHRRLLDAAVRQGAAGADNFTLASYRQGGRNSLQIVLAGPKDATADTLYADVDIDLGNPLWDAEGLVVHAGELLDSGKTDHFALRSKLTDSPAGEFVYYNVTQAQAAG
jgi:hypothetical protein